MPAFALLQQWCGCRSGNQILPRFVSVQIQIRRLPKPVIAMVAGYAVGGGHVLHMVCDITVGRKAREQMGVVFSSTPSHWDSHEGSPVDGSRWELCVKSNRGQVHASGFLRGGDSVGVQQHGGLKGKGNNGDVCCRLVRGGGNGGVEANDGNGGKQRGAVAGPAAALVPALCSGSLPAIPFLSHMCDVCRMHP